VIRAKELKAESSKAVFGSWRFEANQLNSMDEGSWTKKDEIDKNYEISESLSQGFFVVLLLSEVVFPPPSVFSQRLKRANPRQSIYHLKN
jgi:hypothetical protein